MDLNEKVEMAKEFISGKDIAIAFSGGSDSTLIAYLVREVENKAIAITFNNGLMPSDFADNAERIAKSFGIPHEIINEDFFEVEKFRQNNKNRCFICRKVMYSKIKALAIDNGFETIVDGTNISDLLEDRPGIMVNYENDILSPLVKAGIEKEEVLEFLNNHGIEYSKSTSCLATRISNGEEITPKKINRIQYAENLLKNLIKDDGVRVRDLGGTAQIEVGNIEPLLSKNTLKLIESELKAVNFEKVTLDIGSNVREKKDLVLYKPCKDEANKIMFENELPYEIDIKQTCTELENVGEVKCSQAMGVAMVDIDGRNVTVFKNGKIVARKVADKEDAHDILVKTLPLIRRKL